jgi:hypothetical protein
MISLGAAALWELWQRISELERAAQQQRVNDPDRKRQAGGRRKKEAEVLCRLLATLLYLRHHWTMPALAEAIGCARRNTTTPIKKPKGGQLTPAQKDFNRQVSQKRVYVEHLIRVIKIFRIVKEEFRMRDRMYELVIGCVCGLVRLRAQYV